MTMTWFFFFHSSDPSPKENSFLLLSLFTLFYLVSLRFILLQMLVIIISISLIRIKASIGRSTFFLLSTSGEWMRCGEKWQENRTYNEWKAMKNKLKKKKKRIKRYISWSSSPFLQKLSSQFFAVVASFLLFLFTLTQSAYLFPESLFAFLLRFSRI